MMNGHEVMLDAVKKRLDEVSTREFIHKLVIKDVIREIERFQMAVDEKEEHDPLANLDYCGFWDSGFCFSDVVGEQGCVGLDVCKVKNREKLLKAVKEPITWNLEDGE